MYVNCKSKHFLFVFFNVVFSNVLQIIFQFLLSTLQLSNIFKTFCLDRNLHQLVLIDS